MTGRALTAIGLMALAVLPFVAGPTGAAAQLPPPATTPVPTADLSVSLDRDGGAVDEGERYTYEATVVNNGPGAARNVVIFVSPPDDFDLDDTNQDGECRTDPGTEGRMACYFDILQPGGEIVLKFRGAFRHDGSGKTHVSVFSVTTDPDLSNNTPSGERVNVRENEPGDGDGGASGDENPCPDPDILGTDEDDDIIGTNGDDVIDALDGSDTVLGDETGAGEDVICGGDSGDRIDGGGGEDEIFGEEDNDDLLGAGDGDADLVDGGEGNDTCIIDEGVDTAVDCETVEEVPVVPAG